MKYIINNNLEVSAEYTDLEIITLGQFHTDRGELIIDSTDDRIVEDTEGKTLNITIEEFNSLVIESQKIKVVTRRQAFRALSRLGLLQTVKDAVEASDNEDLKIEWETASEFRRDWDLLIVISNIIGWSDADVDIMFKLANSL